MASLSKNSKNTPPIEPDNGTLTFPKGNWRQSKIELAADKETSLLWQFISAVPEPSANHLLHGFQHSLVDLSENSQRAYCTDVWVFIREKLFNFWDFRTEFNQAAHMLALLHALDTSTFDTNRDNHHDSETQQLLDYANSFLTGIRSSLKPINTSSRSQMTNFFGSEFNCEQSDGRFRMTLRGQGSPLPQVLHIRNEDRAMLNLLFSSFGPAFGNSFWEDVFAVDKVGEILNFHKQRGNSENTIARKMASLERFEGFLASKNLLEKRVMPFMRRPSVRPRKQIVLSSEEMTKLFDHLEQKFKKSSNKGNTRDTLLIARDRAMISLLDLTLGRGSAICGIRLADIQTLHRKRKNSTKNSKPRVLKENKKSFTLLIREKGRKESLVPIEGTAHRALLDFLKLRPEFLKIYKVSEKHTDFLFHNRLGTPMTRRSLSRNLDQYASACGLKKSVNGKTRIGTHVVRRSAASEMSEQGAPIEDLRDLMNHSSIATTERYLSSVKRDLSKAVKKYHPRA